MNDANTAALWLRWVWAIGLLAMLCHAVKAQEAPAIAEKPPIDRMANPLNDTARKIQQRAVRPLPKDVETTGRDLLSPVFTLADSLPVKWIEEEAFKHRRARIRLTAPDRQPTEQPFRLMTDFAANPDLYWGQPMVWHGYLKSLRRVPASEEQPEVPALWLGEVRLWNEEFTGGFLARNLPEGLSAGENDEVPVSVVGFLFAQAGEAEAPPTPLLLARMVIWLKPALDLRTLVDVRDRTLSIPETEADAYYRTLLHAKLVDEAAQKDRAKEFWEARQKQLQRPRPLFVDLFKTFGEDPNIYRGQSVTLTGTLRKLRQITTDPLNDYGLETLYEAWIFDEDAQSNPTVIVFSENPDNLPEGDELTIPAKVTGYVFKMYGYESRDKDHPLRVAPLLLAKSVRKMAIGDPEPFPIAWVTGAIAVLCVGIVLFVWISNRKDRAFRKQTLRKEEEEPPRFDNLNGQDSRAEGLGPENLE